MERDLHPSTTERDNRYSWKDEGEMRVFLDRDEGMWERNATTFALGALGGVALGLVVSRFLPHEEERGGRIQERARGYARRLRPARMQRLGFEQADLDRLEGAVLDTFLGDPLLSERGVDIGAISPGIVELSGSVRTDEEAQRAVRLANRVPGVRTVVNRLDVESLAPRAGRPLADSDAGGIQQDGRVGGMGRRRQSLATDPDQPDDSQQRRENALAAADREQWADEGIAPGMSARGRGDEAEASDRSMNSLEGATDRARDD